MKSAARPLLLSVVAIAVLLALLLSSGGKDKSLESLLFYCAAGMKGPMEEIARNYEAEFGVQIQLQYGGSGTLLSNLELSGEGDLYLAADASYIEIAKEKGLVAESIPLARLQPILIVAQGNPKGIQGIADLLRADIRTALANPDAASVGKTTKAMLERSGQWNAVETAVRARGVFKPTVNEVANDVKLGTVDVGIIWDATAGLYPDLVSLRLPEAEGFVKSVTVGILNTTRDSAAALRFARYVAAPEKGQQILEEHGYAVFEGDAWAARPEIFYFAGGVNRVAIEDTLDDFAAREGVHISRIYNGCGILLGSIKGGERPDVYHTCDVSFMKGVEALFGDADPISRTDIVLLTRTGNPDNLHRLEDLVKPGLELGLCNEEQSTLGALTAAMLRRKGVYEAVQKNVIVNTPTADLLVAQIAVGKLDAAVVYRANTLGVGNKAEVLALSDADAKATQSYANARDSKYPQLLARLHAALRTATSKDRYLAAGFEYLELPSAE